MRPGRIVAGLVLALVLALAAPTAVEALWSSRGTASAAVTAGRVQVAQSGFEALAAVFGSTESARVAVAPVTVTNTGTVPADFTLQLGAETANNVARAVKVSVWAIPGGADCSASTPVPAGVPTVDWPIVSPLTGSLDPSAAAVFCVRTAISAEDVAALPGGSVVATLRLFAEAGNWTYAGAARVTQTVSGSGSGSGSGGTVTPMPAPADPAPLDPAPAPTPTSSPTPSPAPTATRATIAIAGTTWCASESLPTDTAPTPTVYAQTCDTAGRRIWLISPEVDGFRSIDSTTSASTTWTADGARIRLTAASGQASQQWALRENPDGSTRFVSRADGRCLTVAPMPSLYGARQPFSLAACDGSAAQSFTLSVQS